MSEDNLLDLGGQVAFVSGAGQGLGRDIALALARHNAGGVAINDFDAEKAEAVVEEVRALGVPAAAAVADVGDLDSVTSAVAGATDALGPITLLVNNAGNAGPDSRMGFSPEFWETQPEDWARFFHTNLYGVMNCCHAIAPGMVKARRGRIVSIISDAGRVGDARLTAYSAAKAGAAGFMRALARETGRYGITANCVSLSTLVPPLEGQELEDFLQSDRAKAQLSRYALRRYGEPQDVSGMVVFLCSDAASWITGQTYPVNGGYSFAL